jgi:hypothetical protein
MCSMSVHNTNHQQMHKESFVINRNRLLRVSTPLGHLQGELFCYRYTKVALMCSAGRDGGEFAPPKTTQYTVNSTFSTIKCNLSVTITKKFSLKMTQQGRNM